MTVTQEYLKSILDYNSETGVFTWKISKQGNKGVGSMAGAPDPRGYIRLKINSHTYHAHRLVFLYICGIVLPSDIFVDHINGNTSDNRLKNLRLSSNQQIQFNSKLNLKNKLSCKNICYIKDRNKYRVTLAINGKNRILGHFEDIELAKFIAKEARSKYHGNFARDK